MHDSHPLYSPTKDFILNLGGDVIEKTTAMTRNTFEMDFGNRTAAFAKIWDKTFQLEIYARLQLRPEDIVEDFTSDRRDDGNKYRYPAKIIIRNEDDLKRAKPLLKRAYERRKQEGPGGTPPL